MRHVALSWLIQHYEWNNKFLKLQKFGSMKYKQKRREKSKRNRKKLDMKMWCCVIPCEQTDAGSLQKYFLPFRVLLNVGIDPNFPQQGFFFFIQREISLSGEKTFTVALSGRRSCLSWLVHSTPDRVVWVWVLAGDIVLCSWARHFTLTVPLSTQVYKWVPA